MAVRRSWSHSRDVMDLVTLDLPRHVRRTREVRTGFLIEVILRTLEACWEGKDVVTAIRPRYASATTSHPGWPVRIEWRLERTTSSSSSASWLDEPSPQRPIVDQKLGRGTAGKPLETSHNTRPSPLIFPGLPHRDAAVPDNLTVVGDQAPDYGS